MRKLVKITPGFKVKFNVTLFASRTIILKAYFGAVYPSPLHSALFYCSVSKHFLHKETCKTIVHVPRNPHQ